jgi:transmembrane sensor
MTAPSQRTTELMIKTIAGDSTPEEQEELNSIIGALPPAKQQWYRDMLDPLKLAKAKAFAQGVDLKKHQSQWEANAGLQQQPGTRSIGLATWIAAAAVIIVVAGIAIYKGISREEPKQQVTAIPARTEDGQDFFLLPNGEKIGLDSLQEQAIKAGNALLSRHNDTLICEAVNVQTEEPVQLRLFVTKAVYTLVLSDKSKVTLGKNSALRFPTHFHGSERSVDLSGEGYFEVQHQQPDTFRTFLVGNALDTVPRRQAEVQAVGTRFNIRAYANEPQKRVSLVEGSVQVCKNTARMLLNAGEEAVFTLTGNPEKQKIKMLKDVGAWRNGRILFTDTEVLTIMRDLERHYDSLQVNVTADVAKEKITLYSSYDRTIGYLVDLIKHNNTNIAIRKEGNTIYVTRPSVQH